MGSEATQITSARDALSRITLEMTSRLKMGEVLAAITRGLIDDLGMVLARIWLLMPDRLCPSCVARGQLGETPALHLVTSAGIHTRTDGSYHRVLVGALKIGEIAARREAFCSNDLLSDPRIPDKEWVREHGLQSFAGYPLLFRGELLGVLGTFSARQMEPNELEWLGIFAHQAAIAIQNARLFSALERANLFLRAENEYLQGETESEGGFEGMVGRSPQIRRVQKQIRQVAPTDSTVLITGEAGTGRETVARTIHELSPRRDRSLVKVKCEAITESELFGHERGAFAGAVQRRISRFELADGGTLLLDEVGALPLDVQVRLLRVVQEQEIERLGGSRAFRVDIRIVATTHQNLAAMVDEGAFHSELFYHLNVFPIAVPPLRARSEDIPALVDHFLACYAKQFRKRLIALSPESMERLLRYSWPGNIRELQTVIERACIIAQSPVVEVNDPLLEATAPAGSTATLEEVERQHIRRVLSKTRGRIEGPRGAALILGLHPNTLRSRMQRLGILRPHRGP